MKYITENQKQKISSTLKIKLEQLYKDGRLCEKCGKRFYSKDLSRKMCFDCLPTTIKHNAKNSSRKIKSIQDVSSRTASKILKRLELPCSCCGIYFPGVVFDIHHIISRKNGGVDDMTNITYICPNCHRIAHTNESLLPGKLVPLVEQLKSLGKDWFDYYYG